MTFPHKMIFPMFLCFISGVAVAGDCYYVNQNQTSVLEMVEDRADWPFSDGFEGSVTLFFNGEERKADVVIAPLSPMIVNTSTTVGGEVSRSIEDVLWSATFQFEDGGILETSGRGSLHQQGPGLSLFNFILDVDSGSGVYSRAVGKLSLTGHLGDNGLDLATVGGKLCKVRSFAHPFR